MELRSYLVLGDLHYPSACPKYIKLSEKLIREHDFDGLIQCGDFCDWPQISRFDKDPSRKNTILDDLLLFKNQLDKYELILKKGSVVHITPGNHESRFSRYLWSKAPEIHEVVRSIPEILEFHTRNKRGKVKFIYHDYNDWKSCKVGNCYIFHGFWYGKHVTQTVLEKYGNVNTVFGHTHRCSIIYNSENWSLNVGHGAIAEHVEHQPTPNNWHQAMAILTVVNGKTSAELIAVKDGCAVVRGKFYEV